MANKLPEFKSRPEIAYRIIKSGLFKCVDDGLLESVDDKDEDPTPPDPLPPNPIGLYGLFKSDPARLSPTTIIQSDRTLDFIIELSEIVHAWAEEQSSYSEEDFLDVSKAGDPNERKEALARKRDEFATEWINQFHNALIRFMVSWGCPIEVAEEESEIICKKKKFRNKFRAEILNKIKDSDAYFGVEKNDDRRRLYGMCRSLISAFTKFHKANAQESGLTETKMKYYTAHLICRLEKGQDTEAIEVKRKYWAIQDYLRQHNADFEPTK